MKPSVSFDETRRKILRDPESAAVYLEEMLQDGDMEQFTMALKHVAEAQGGVSGISRKTRLNRETLYRTLSKKGNPQLDTLTKILAAMKLRLSIVPAEARA